MHRLPDQTPGNTDKGCGKMTYPWTVNGTAMAVPRVLAAIFENGWNEDELTVTIPEVLRPWMDGQDKIGPPTRRR